MTTKVEPVAIKSIFSKGQAQFLQINGRRQRLPPQITRKFLFVTTHRWCRWAGKTPPVKRIFVILPKSAFGGKDVFIHDIAETKRGQLEFEERDIG